MNFNNFEKFNMTPETKIEMKNNGINFLKTLYNVIKNKNFIITIVSLTLIYFINPFGVFDSQEVREKKLIEKNNNFIKEYIISSADALETYADTQTTIEQVKTENEKTAQNLKNEICGLKSQYDSLELDLSKTCPDSGEVISQNDIKKDEEIKKELKTENTSLNVYKSKEYPFKDFSYYVTANNTRDNFTQQMKDLKWRLNADLKSQEYVELEGNTVKERLASLLKHYKAPDSEIWFRTAEVYGIKPEVAICISKADSSLGRELTTKNNFGNVGNNDRGDRVHYDSEEAGIAAISKVLINKYIGNNTKIGELSGGGRANMGLPDCGAGNWCYATSKDNWNVNVINCLSMVHNKAINEDFLYRIEK